MPLGVPKIYITDNPTRTVTVVTPIKRIGTGLTHVVGVTRMQDYFEDLSGGISSMEPTELELALLVPGAMVSLSAPSAGRSFSLATSVPWFCFYALWS